MAITMRVLPAHLYVPQGHPPPPETRGWGGNSKFGSEGLKFSPRGFSPWRAPRPVPPPPQGHPPPETAGCGRNFITRLCALKICTRVFSTMASTMRVLPAHLNVPPDPRGHPPPKTGGLGRKFKMRF